MEKLSFSTRILNNIRILFRNKPFENFLFQLVSQGRFGSLVSKLPPNHYQYKQPTWRNRRINGFDLTLDVSNLNDWFAYFNFKDESLENLYDKVNKGDIIFDVGANIGTTSLNFSRITGNQGKVYSFEPHPVTFTRLKKHVVHNQIKNISLQQIGLGSKDAKFKLVTLNSRNSGMNRILKNAPKTINGEEINITTLDSFVDMNKVKKINILKLDVEGFEMEVLLGAKKAISQFHPILFVEIGSKNLKENNTSPQEVYSFLTNLGYKLFDARTLQNIRFSRMDSEDVHFDIIAF